MIENNTNFSTELTTCLSGKQDSQVYRMFEDYIKHFMSIIGYENFNFQKYDSNNKEISFDEKQKIMSVNFRREVHTISGVKDLQFCIENPIVIWAYSTVLYNFLLIFGKYFYFNKSELEIKQIFEDYFGNNNKRYALLFEEKSLSEEIYKVIEPFLDSPKSIIIKKPQNNVAYKCEWCGTRYNYNKLNHCPSCGA